MARTKDKRFVISIPKYLAVQVNILCEAEELCYSDFFCEAAQAYLAAKPRSRLYIAPTDKEDIMGNPFCVFDEWGSKEDCVYDILR